MESVYNLLGRWITPTGVKQNLPSFLPVIEVAADQRVLIENHCGVKEYGEEQISVQVRFGSICVKGHKMKLMHMSKDQLVICGKITGIELFGRE